MASLINDKDTVRQYVRIQFINDQSSLPDFQLAAERFLIPIIGQELYDDLLDQVTDHDFPEDPDSVPEIEDIDLVEKCRAVIAPLGYLVDLPTIQTNITDSGLKTTNTETMQSAHRWEYNEVKAGLEDKGAYAIEALLKYLFENKNDFTEWTSSEEYAEMADLIFRTGSDFNKFFRNPKPYMLWWMLRPLIREVEDFYINSEIGKDLFVSLKEEEEPTNEEKEAILLIKKAVANITIVKAIEKMAVKITPQGFTILIGAGNSDAANSGDEPARDPQLSLLYDSCTRSGEAYLLELREYLNNTASETLFTDYFESDKYVEPGSESTVSKNACRKIFGL